MKRFQIILIFLMLLVLAGCGEEKTYPVALQEALPQKEEIGAYEITLTPQQKEKFESGVFTLLYNQGGDKYVPFYSGTKLTLDGDRLQANFNGKLPYVVSEAGHCCLPSVRELETEDGKTHYAVQLRMGNYISENGEEIYKVEDFVLHMLCDRSTGQILHTQMLPEAQEVEADFFAQREQWQMETPESYVFLQGGVYMVSKNADGEALPLAQWEYTGGISGMDWSGEAGLYPAYGRLATVTAPYALQDVYMAFSLQDKQGEEFYTTLLPVTALEVPEIRQPTAEAKQIKWEAGNRTLLLEENGVTVYMTKTSDYGDVVYGLELKNDNEFAVDLQVNDIVFNDRFTLTYQRLTADAASWCKSASLLRFPIAAVTGELDQIESISLRLVLANSETDKKLMEYPLQIAVEDTAALQAIYRDRDQFDIREPQLEFLQTEQQLLVEQDGVKISLVKAGSTGSGQSMTILYRVENTTNNWRNYLFEGVAINDLYCHKNQSSDLAPKEIYYSYVNIEDFYNITKIGEVRMRFGAGVGKGSQFTETAWCTLDAQQTAEDPTPFAPGSHILLEERGLRITLLQATKSQFGETIWQLAVTNTTDQWLSWGIYEGRLGDTQATGLQYPGFSVNNTCVGPQQTAVVQIRNTSGQDASFRLWVMNGKGDTHLFTTKGRVQLRQDDVENS